MFGPAGATRHTAEFAVVVDGARHADAVEGLALDADGHRRDARGFEGARGERDGLVAEARGGDEQCGLRTQVDKDAAVERLAELGEVVPTRRTRSPQTIRVTRQGTRQD